jgi:glycosyltransferase involved in cell wall biosynthesis
MSNAAGIYHEHSGGLLAGQFIPRLIHKYLYSNYVRIIAISDLMRGVIGQVNQIAMNRTVTIHNGIDVDEIRKTEPASYSDLPSQWEKQKIAIGIVARLVEQKGVTTFLQVAGEISKIYPNAVFPIVGDGPLRGQLEAQSYKMNLSDAVMFLGYRVDAVRVMKRFDVLLFTSNEDGFGLVIPEAMAAHIPVVALQKRSAVAEIIDDGVDGIIVRNDTPEAIANAVVLLLENGELVNRIKDNALRKVESEFSMHVNARRVMDLYQTVLQERAC